MNKKVVVLGGGTGASYLLRGLKDFPLDITAIISVSDSGKSAGKLRDEFHIPAVGDLRRVIVSLSDVDNPIKEMMQYRFHTISDLDGHSLGNLILTAMLDITGSLKESINALGKILELKHTVLPLSEDADITLAGLEEDGTIIEGEEQITKSHAHFERIFYKEEPTIVKEAIKAIEEADLIILSMGSIYTSILPHIISREVRNAIDRSKAHLMYICNIVTQPGETDHFTVGDHVKLINKYLNQKKIEVVIANGQKIEEEMAKKYETKEQKAPVVVDKETVKNMGIELITEDLVSIEDNTLKHNSLKLSSLVFSYIARD